MGDKFGELVESVFSVTSLSSTKSFILIKEQRLSFILACLKHNWYIYFKDSPNNHILKHFGCLLIIQSYCRGCLYMFVFIYMQDLFHHKSCCIYHTRKDKGHYTMLKQAIDYSNLYIPPKSLE